MALLSELADLLLQGGCSLEAAQAGALAAARALQPPQGLVHQRLRFIWLLLPEFFERPSTVAALAAASRQTRMLLKEEGKLHVSRGDRLWWPQGRRM